MALGSWHRFPGTPPWVGDSKVQAFHDFPIPHRRERSSQGWGSVCVGGGPNKGHAPMGYLSLLLPASPPPSKLIMLEFFPAPGRAQVETLFRVELCLPKDVLTSQAPGPVGVALFPGSRVFADGIR